MLLIYHEPRGANLWKCKHLHVTYQMRLKYHLIKASIWIKVFFFRGREVKIPTRDVSIFPRYSRVVSKYCLIAVEYSFEIASRGYPIGIRRPSYSFVSERVIFQLIDSVQRCERLHSQQGFGGCWERENLLPSRIHAPHMEGEQLRWSYHEHHHLSFHAVRRRES